jgi:hypothetical protein
MVSSFTKEERKIFIQLLEYKIRDLPNSIYIKKDKFVEDLSKFFIESFSSSLVDSRLVDTIDTFERLYTKYDKVRDESKRIMIDPSILTPICIQYRKVKGLGPIHKETVILNFKVATELLKALLAS